MIVGVGPLNEVYLGKDAIKHFQDAFSKVRKKIKGKPVNSSTNMDPEILKFNRVAENTFGFKSYALYIQPSYLPNAYAFPVYTFYTPEERKRILNSLTADASGFKYKKVFPGVSFIMAINAGMIDDDRYSDEELVAVMLHEVGHSFFEAVTDPDDRYTTARRMNGLVSKINDLIKEKIKQGKAVTIDIINAELIKFNTAFNAVKKTLSKVLPGSFHESMEDNMRKHRFDYTNEKFADTFAAMFGYGEELHSCLVKMTDNIYKDYYGDEVKQRPDFLDQIDAYIYYFNDFLEYVLNVQDEHPKKLARIKTSVDYIKKELAKEGLDPKMKKELIDELTRLNKIIDDYINLPKDQDSCRAIRLYYTMLYKKFGGDRREQDTDNDALFDTIDDRFEDLNGGF